MTGVNRTTHYLDEHNIHYNLVPHAHSNSSVGSAISAEVPMHAIAKAVMLEDHEGRNVMAILPADYKVSLGKLSDELNGSYHLVKEAEVYKLFADCDHGAVPPLPNAYYLSAIYDDELTANETLFLESGDHETLIKLKTDDFKNLMASHRHMRFSFQAFH